MKKLLIILSLFLVFGCTKDNGNYNYVDLNEVSIEEFETNYSAIRFERLQITPSLTFATDPNAEFDYVWRVYDNNTYDTISMQRDLDIEVNLAPGTYNLEYKVIERATGIFYNKTTTINVTHKLNEGFIILGKNGDNASVAMVNSVGTLFKDIYYKTYGEYLCKNPIMIDHQLYYNHSMYAGREYILVSYEGGKAKLLHPAEFAVMGTAEKLFTVSPKTLNIQGYLSEYGQATVLLNNGKIHLTLYSEDFSPALLPAYNGNLGGDFTDYKISVHNFCRAGTALLYDNLNGTFITFDYPYTNLSQPFRSKEPEDLEIFDPYDVGLEILSAGNHKDNCVGLFKDTDGKMYILKFSYLASGKKGQRLIPLDKYEVTTAPHLSADSEIVHLGYSSELLIYYSGGKLYSFDTNTKTETLVHDFGTNYTINNLFVNYNQLAVGVSNNDLSEKSGECIIFEVSYSGGFAITEIGSYKAIADEIVDIAYKYDETK